MVRQKAEPKPEPRWQIVMRLYLKQRGIPWPCQEYKFHPERLWRLDFAWQECKVAIEVQGGIWARGKSGHTSGSGLTRDYAKHNAAVCLGWRILFFTPAQMLAGDFMRETVDLLEQEEYIL